VVFHVPAGIEDLLERLRSAGVDAVIVRAEHVEDRALLRRRIEPRSPAAERGVGICFAGDPPRSHRLEQKKQLHGRARPGVDSRDRKVAEEHLNGRQRPRASRTKTRRSCREDLRATIRYQPLPHGVGAFAVPHGFEDCIERRRVLGRHSVIEPSHGCGNLRVVLFFFMAHRDGSTSA
jgi:hypothetical protein